MAMRYLIAAGTVALALAIGGAILLRAEPEPGRLAGTIGHGDYALATTDGTPFTEETLAGAPSAVFFGFTHCPDVCPTTLGDISLWQDRLAEMGEEPLRTFFVTVDPERDTLEVLGNYVSWAPGVTAVSGPPEAVREAIEAFRIYARKVPLDGGGYTMDHSAYVMLFDEDGEFFEPVAYQEDTERVMAKLDRLLNG